MGATLSCELGALLGAHKLFTQLFVGIMRAPQWFFDITPTGRVLDRLSNDIYILDLLLPQNLRVCCQQLFRVRFKINAHKTN